MDDLIERLRRKTRAKGLIAKAPGVIGMDREDDPLTTEAAERIAKLEAEKAALLKDRGRLDFLRAECVDVRWISGGIDEVGLQLVDHHMAEPRERVIAENWNEDLRGAIDDANTALKSRKQGQ